MTSQEYVLALQHRIIELTKRLEKNQCQHGCKKTICCSCCKILSCHKCGKVYANTHTLEPKNQVEDPWNGPDVCRMCDICYQLPGVKKHYTYIEEWKSNV